MSHIPSNGSDATNKDQHLDQPAIISTGANVVGGTRVQISDQMQGGDYDKHYTKEDAARDRAREEGRARRLEMERKENEEFGQRLLAFQQKYANSLTDARVNWNTNNLNAFDATDREEWNRLMDRFEAAVSPEVLEREIEGMLDRAKSRVRLGKSGRRQVGRMAPTDKYQPVASEFMKMILEWREAASQ